MRQPLLNRSPSRMPAQHGFAFAVLRPTNYDLYCVPRRLKSLDRPGRGARYRAPTPNRCVADHRSTDNDANACSDDRIDDNLRRAGPSAGPCSSWRNRHVLGRDVPHGCNQERRLLRAQWHQGLVRKHGGQTVGCYACYSIDSGGRTSVDAYGEDSLCARQIQRHRRCSGRRGRPSLGEREDEGLSLLR